MENNPAADKLQALVAGFRSEVIKDIHIILSSYNEGSQFVFDKTDVVLRTEGDPNARASYLAISINTDGDIHCVSHDWDVYFQIALDTVTTTELARIHDVLVRQEFQHSEPVRVSD
jgi:glutaminase